MFLAVGMEGITMGKILYFRKVKQVNKHNVIFGS